jgi:uncharacterized membrane protein YqjE
MDLGDFLMSAVASILIVWMVDHAYKPWVPAVVVILVIVNIIGLWSSGGE